MRREGFSTTFVSQVASIDDLHHGWTPSEDQRDLQSTLTFVAHDGKQIRKTCLRAESDRMPTPTGSDMANSSRVDQAA